MRTKGIFGPGAWVVSEETGLATCSQGTCITHDPTVFCSAVEVWYNLDAMGNEGFWSKLDHLVDASHLVVDRPAGTAHPCFPSFVYPLDYGYLEGTRSGDGEGVDVWVGSRPERAVTAIVCTVDLELEVAELKILVGCSEREANEMLGAHNVGSQSAVLIKRSEGHWPASEVTKRQQEGNR